MMTVGDPIRTDHRLIHRHSLVPQKLLLRPYGSSQKEKIRGGNKEKCDVETVFAPGHCLAFLLLKQKTIDAQARPIIFISVSHDAHFHLGPKRVSELEPTHLFLLY